MIKFLKPQQPIEVVLYCVPSEGSTWPARTEDLAAAGYVPTPAPGRGDSAPAPSGARIAELEREVASLRDKSAEAEAVIAEWEDVGHRLGDILFAAYGHHTRQMTLEQYAREIVQQRDTARASLEKERGMRESAEARTKQAMADAGQAQGALDAATTEARDLSLRVQRLVEAQQKDRASLRLHEAFVAAFDKSMPNLDPAHYADLLAARSSLPSAAKSDTRHEPVPDVSMPTIATDCRCCGNHWTVETNDSDPGWRWNNEDDCWTCPKCAASLDRQVETLAQSAAAIRKAKNEQPHPAPAAAEEARQRVVEAAKRLAGDTLTSGDLAGLRDAVRALDASEKGGAK